MNKQMIFAFVVGAVAGALPSAIYFKSKYDTMAREKDEEIEKMREYYLAKEQRSVKKSVEKAVADTKHDIYNRMIEQYTPYNKPEPLKPTTELNDPAEEEHPEEDEPEEEINERLSQFAEEEYARKKNLGIREIDRDEYDEDEDNCETLFYYYDDDTLADEDGNIVDEDKVLGSILTDSDFKNVLNNETVIYIRNGPLDIKYEVIKILDSYRESVGKGD